MLICNLINGIYESNLLVMNKEIEGKEVTELIQMLITLTHIDIFLEEVPMIRANVRDHHTVYKLLEEEGNIMKEGRIWRARAAETILKTFQAVMTASKIIDTYELHKEVLEKFIMDNKYDEKQEFIKIGWIETFEKNVKIRVKMTKRTSDT